MFTIGQRIEIPVHYDLWMRGARFGTISSFRKGCPGISECYMVKMDHPQVKKRLKLWALDWDYAKAIAPPNEAGLKSTLKRFFT